MINAKLDGERTKKLLVNATKAYLKTERIKELGEKYSLVFEDFLAGPFVQYASSFNASLHFNWSVERSTYDVRLELKLVDKADKEEEFSVPDEDWMYRVVLQTLQEWHGGKLVNRIFSFGDSGEDTDKSIFPSLVIEETDVGQVIIGYRLSD